MDSSFQRANRQSGTPGVHLLKPMVTNRCLVTGSPVRDAPTELQADMPAWLSQHAQAHPKTRLWKERWLPPPRVGRGFRLPQGPELGWDGHSPGAFSSRCPDRKGLSSGCPVGWGGGCRAQLTSTEYAGVLGTLDGCRPCQQGQQGSRQQTGPHASPPPLTCHLIARPAGSARQRRAAGRGEPQPRYPETNTTLCAAPVPSSRCAAAWAPPRP